VPPALRALTGDASGFVKTAIRPCGGVIGRFARYRLLSRREAVMLVLVLRCRAAVTLGHDTSLLSLDGSVHLSTTSVTHISQPDLAWDVPASDPPSPSDVEYPIQRLVVTFEPVRRERAHGIAKHIFQSVIRAVAPHTGDELALR
jgi:hypothetical protein